MVTQTKYRKREQERGEIENPSEPKPRWCLCPDCKGLGWIESSKRFKTLQGVRILGHIPCSTCNGQQMIKTDEKERDGVILKPVKLCGSCLNWYAVGGGRKASEPCPHNHAAKSHCHWHDLSVYPPPDVQRRQSPEPQPISWEEPALVE